jgi:ribonuclease HI
MEPDAIVFCDGGCTANPGSLAVAAVVCSTTYQIILQSARHAGEGSNNVAEYRALSYAICMARLAGARRPLFCSDSALVVQQVNGYWAMTGSSPLHDEHACCTSMLMDFERWTLKHVPRERNKRADWLVSSLLGHSRTLKHAPEIAQVQHDGEGRPGWATL